MKQTEQTRLPHLFFCMPIGDVVQGPTFISSVNALMPYIGNGGQLTTAFTWLSSNVAEARRTLARQAFESGADRIIMADSDVTFSLQDLVTMATVEEDVVSGIYLTRGLNPTVVGTPVPNVAETKGALIEFQRIGLGFASISRKALGAMLERFGDGIFQFRQEGTRIKAEDESFSDKWRELGGKIWIHQGVRCGHVGPHVFQLPEPAAEAPPVMTPNRATRRANEPRKKRK